MMPADNTPACGDQLDLVDAAFTAGRAGNAAARDLAKLCRRCPVAADCAHEQLEHPSAHGVWGGLRRTRSSGSAAGRIKVVA